MTSHLVPDDDLELREPSGTDAAASVCALIAAHAAARPGDPAVADDRGPVTYGELERRAGLLTARLASAGIGRGACVGVFLDRSVEFVVAAYAVMRAGAAYLPLEVATPAERLAFILGDAGVTSVVARPGDDRLPSGSWDVVPVDVPVDTDADRAGAAQSEHLTGAAPGPDDLAYVIYTSGSTGRPKGVELTHANLANLVGWHTSAFAVTPADRASQVASVGFDAAVWEIWPYLAAGASVHVVDETIRRSPQLLRDWLLAQRITVGFAPTVLAEQLIHLAWPAATPLRTLLTGADVLHRRPPAGLPFSLVNNYGPTECTVVATSGPVDPAAGGVPSIGRPIGDTVALVLDETLGPVDDGEPGELCLGGALVGRGYRNDPELTARRFVTLHRGAGPAVRVYRTGDRVRRLPNGEIAFLGRLDRQVKLRGYRIEPDEIVAALGRAPAVAAAAVVVHPAGADDGADRELVAYVVPAEGVSLTAAELRAPLAAVLPEYMVPARFVTVPALPVTLHGKLDEAALPAPGPENLLPDSRPEPVPAATAATVPSATDGVDDRISEMVCALLKLPSIAHDENIFLVGGHSMLAMQLVSRIKQTFGVRLTLRQVFEEPTVAGIGATVGARLATAGPSAGVAGA